jgi:hypothetical protein
MGELSAARRTPRPPPTRRHPDAASCRSDQICYLIEEDRPNDDVFTVLTRFPPEKCTPNLPARPGADV